jgi:hypothetical protein
MIKKIWHKIQQSSRKYSDELLRSQVKEALFKARIESMLALDASQREIRLIMIINALLLAMAFYFKEFARLSRSLALSIYILLIVRLIFNWTKIAIKLYKTRQTGLIYHIQRYRHFGGVRHHKKAFRATFHEIFTLQYATRVGKGISILHNGLIALDLTHSQEEIFEYFYKETLSTFKKFFFSSLLSLIVEILSYLLITFIIRQMLFNLPVY